MATITLEAFKVFNASIAYINNRKKFWDNMVDEEGNSLLTETELASKFKILSLMEMSHYNDITTIEIDNYEFILLKDYLT